jgi:hypothetical protein
VPAALGQRGAGQPQIARPDVTQARALQLAFADRDPPERTLKEASARRLRVVEICLLKEHRVEIGPVEIGVTPREHGGVGQVG